eukprot:3543112-Rhodomonas_salina.1
MSLTRRINARLVPLPKQLNGCLPRKRRFAHSGVWILGRSATFHLAQACGLTGSSAIVTDRFPNTRLGGALVKFTLSYSGKLSWYLSVAIDHDTENGILTLSQETYIDTLLECFSMTDAHPVPTPSEQGTLLVKAQSPAVPDPDATKKYQQMVGGLMYAAVLTCPDIVFSVNQCARFMSNPGPEHVAAAKRILQYLKGTKHLKLTYRRQSEATANVLVCYADSDHAGDPDTRRSVTWYVVMLNSAAVSWQSTRQQVTALSTAEAQYYAALVAGTNVTYMLCIMEDLGYKQEQQTVLWEDNMACIYMSQTSVMYHKASHIDMRVYHLRELCKDSVMVLEKVASVDQVADSLTKSTPKPAFEKHSSSMMGLPLVVSDSMTSLTPVQTCVVATGANVEDIKMGDDDDDEHGMIALGDVVPNLPGTLSSHYDVWTVSLAASLFSVLYGFFTVVTMLIPMVKDGFALLLSAVAAGKSVADYLWDPPVDAHHCNMVLLVRATGA